LGNYARVTQQIERPSGQFFSTKSGVLSFAQQPLRDNTVDVVVIASMHENVYYPQQYNPDNVSSPVCYAFALDGNDMAPHADAGSPVDAACSTCPNNKWDTGAGGRGKACKNIRRLSLMPVSALSSAEEVAKATVGYLRVPVTSVKHWVELAQGLAARGVPPFAAVTRIKLQPDAKTMHKLSFDPLRVITEPEILDALEKRHLAEEKLISFPYPKPDPAPATATKQPAAPAAAAKASKF
jgi:hypothetical protein